MRVTSDALVEGRSFPLSNDDVRRLVERIAPPAIAARVRCVHLGVNARTTQEARLASRGEDFEIRLNFWLADGRSKLLSTKPGWVATVRRFGGRVDAVARQVEWEPGDAARYAAFLLAHEIAHVVYAEQKTLGKVEGRRGTPSEERWCDEWAIAALARVKGIGGE